MKRFFAPALALLLCAALLPGCAVDGGAPETVPTPGLGIANPMAEVENAAALAQAGVPIDAPEGASDVKYHIIGGTVAQVTFTLGDHAYTYRAALGGEDISGVYATFLEEVLTVNWEFETKCIPATVKTTADGGRLAAWQDGGASYSLWAVSGPDDDAISAVIRSLIAQQHGGTGGAAAAPFMPVDFLGEGSAKADLDGDGREETATMVSVEDEYGWLQNVFTVTTADGEEYAFHPGEETWLTELQYLSALQIIDLDPEDGLLEVVVSGDYASDDFATLLFRFDGKEISLAGHVDGDGREYPGIYGEFRGIGEDGAIIIGNHVDMLGTWWGMRPYTLSGSGFTFAPAPDTLWVRSIDLGDPETWSGDYGPALEVASPLPVTLEGEETLLPAGLRLIITAGDGDTYMEFVTEDGRAGSVSYDASIRGESGWDRSICGLDETVYFTTLPYAG